MNHVDLVLSSGFLAFARHAGFLAAVEARGFHVEALCGTSSGAVCAALWAAGRSAAEITETFRGLSLMSLGRPSATFWRGVLSMGAFTDFLRDQLPARFEELPRPLAVGVVDQTGAHQLLTSGPLPEAVAASCAMPFIFSPVPVANTRYADGGAADRLGLGAYRRWRKEARLVVAHWVERTAGKDVEAALEGTVVVRTPRSGARFWNLGDVRAQMEEAREITRQALEQLRPDER
ncbi:MAG: patatin-like phospholipase family protein [Myxococcota bacterium]